MHSKAACIRIAAYELLNTVLIVNSIRKRDAALSPYLSETSQVYEQRIDGLLSVNTRNAGNSGFVAKNSGAFALSHVSIIPSTSNVSICMELLGLVILSQMC